MPESELVFFPGETSSAEISTERPRPGVALCLSGGGYRAMLFHVGALWRLNEIGYLPRLAQISSVSGGSITAGVLALAWTRLAFDARGVGQRFVPEIVQPLCRLAGVTIDIPSVLRGALGAGTINAQVAQAYRRYLFGRQTLQDLPDEETGPRFVITAANLQSGALWRFSRAEMRDYRVGEVRRPQVEVAVAVAASSAFPPFLSPAVLPLPESAYTPRSGQDLQRPPYTTQVTLSDGGVYDNLGLEPAWKRYQTILVSDGGGKMQPDERPPGDWFRHMRRVLDVVDNQVRSLRKRQVIGSYTLAATDAGHRDGAYWGIRSDIANYGLAEALPCPPNQTLRLANVSTRLARLDVVVQHRLINWGYAICDAALRRHVTPEVAVPTAFPYAAEGIG